MLAVKRTQPLLLCVLVDASRVAPHWEAMLDTLDAVSPLVDDVAAGHAYVDLRGIPGDPVAWIAQTRALLAPYALPTRIAAAANKFTAYAAAQTQDGAICAVGQERAFLAPLSLQLLGIDDRLHERLRMLGVTTLGELARLPHGPFVRRFGMQAARWHLCARGEDPTPLFPRAQAIAIEATTFGEGNIEEEAQLFFAMRIVLARVCADLERCGKRAGMLELSLEMQDGSERHIEVPVATPSADEKVLDDVLRAKLGGSRFPCAIVGFRLRAVRLEEGGEAVTMFPADDVDPQRVAVTLARLEAVTGEPPQRAHTKPAHALERRFTFETFTLRHSEREKLEVRPELKNCDEGLLVQLCLLTVREINVTVKHGAPAFVDARAVTACEGPWRIEEGWFSETEIARDEYKVLLADKSLLRIYRQGKHWYLRGVYD